MGVWACVCRFNNGLGSGLDGGHYRAYVNGTLEIKRALPEDQGTYTCVASNIMGKVEIQVRLEVKGQSVSQAFLSKVIFVLCPAVGHLHEKAHGLSMNIVTLATAHNELKNATKRIHLKVPGKHSTGAKPMTVMLL